jgi:hypothetical protein
MKWTNAISTVSAILSFISLAMIQVLHCNTVADFVAKCETDIIPQAYLAYTSMFFLGVTLLLKALRPGGWVYGWFAPTAVVVPESKAAPGVVTPAQVASK